MLNPQTVLNVTAGGNSIGGVSVSSTVGSGGGGGGVIGSILDGGGGGDGIGSSIVAVGSDIFASLENDQLTLCEHQHFMYDHLDNFLNLFNGVNSTQNLTALLKHDPCYLPKYETNMTIPSSSWIIEFDFWCSGILINLIGMVGILGNSLSLIILSRPQMRSSINYLLIALARCDIILIITSMFLFGFNSIYPYSYADDVGGSMFWFRYTYNVYPRIIKYLFTVAVIAQTANCYLTLLVSLERYVAVCHPLRAVS